MVWEAATDLQQTAGASPNLGWEGVPTDIPSTNLTSSLASGTVVGPHAEEAAGTIRVGVEAGLNHSNTLPRH